MPLQLRQVGLVDLLESDPRPTFVVTLETTASPSISASAQTDEPYPPSIVYANPSLTAYAQLLDLLVSNQPETHNLFWKWIVAPSSPSNEPSVSGGRGNLGDSSFWYLNLLWTKSVVSSLWVVVGANEEPPSSERPHKMLQQTTIPTRELDASSPALVSEQNQQAPLSPLDEPKPHLELSAALTAYLDRDQLTFLNAIHSRNWAATPLGPLEQWPARLRQIFYQIITDSHPTAIYWGESSIVIYNHAFSKLCGTQHPGLLGKPAPSTWPDVDTVPKSPVALFNQRNEWITVQNEALIFITDNNGALLETHINSSITPIIDAGEVGFLHSVQDVTDSRLWERRMNMLCNLSDTLLSAQDVKSYWRKIMEGLEEHSSALDVPLAILYSVDSRPHIAGEAVVSEFSGKHTSICQLEGSLGVPAGHALIPETLDLDQSSHGLVPGFREAFLTRQQVILRASDGSLPADLFEGLALRGFGDRCKTIVICPIRPTKRNDPRGLLLLGLNPRRPYDNHYERYVSLLNQKLSAYLASSMLLEIFEHSDSHLKANGNAVAERASVEMTTEDEIAPPAEAIVLDPIPHEITKDNVMASPFAQSPEPDFLVPTASPPQRNPPGDTVVKTHEIEKLQRLAELATVGICETDLNGRLIDANKVFFDLCGIPMVDDLAAVDVRPWEICVSEEQKTSLLETLGRLIKDSMPQTTEVRLNSPWSAQDSSGKEVKAPRWALATFMPIYSADGAVQAIHGCFSDVSAQKWQLESERRRKEEALESKRQQENFMDMTSHEMRNPLGAIIHCSDAIVASLSQLHNFDISAGEPGRSTELVNPSEPAELGLVERNRIIDESIDNAETIIACAQHQKRIIDDLLTVSKLDSKLISVTPCTVDPLVMVRNALKMFEVEAKRVDVELTMTVDESFTNLHHDHYDFDPSRAKQVLINLLTNALKFTKNRPLRKVSVLVKASRDRPTDAISNVRFMPRSYDEPEYEQPALIGRTDPFYLIFEVKDTGRGLSEDEMRHLFNRFQQASSFTHVNHGGSGLGLFISRRLTELQNGAIGVSSVPKCGSTFVFFIEAYLPNVAASEETALSTSTSAVTLSASAAAIDTRAELSPSQFYAQKANPSSSRRALSIDVDQVLGDSTRLDGILIVEDNSINQQITKRGLTQKGFKVDVANHGLEALEKLKSSRSRSEAGDDDKVSGSKQSFPFNLVLMDIEMPVQDGLSCARKIRELEGEGVVFSTNGGRIPIIAVSAHAKEAQAGAALEAGCDDVLVKPYRMSELVEKMEMLARKLPIQSPTLPTRVTGPL
ncbi:hypothetical protein jhhlp_000544 [Lomentospora prolificans]|uniref:Histidine kinase n=1 Tax=Lomentospora prolificans TaxID=41688 RepID=A0A2N3NLA7_9PEZI|nr:hypothetical protein jhhlp_000544 [Lomentospora prolificans]